ncbi:MAG: tryptophan--tRNA ligase [Myxococcales bacterium]|nr:tryptophan--tRNA ligase [Myxococcales bacterium]
MKTVFSGIQPSGELHLGNYLGAIRNWVALQDQYRCIYCVVDYHAITQTYAARDMPGRVFDMVVDLLALGVDPERSTLFVQSMVPEHTELCWVLNNVTGHGDLERMTQFKDKSQNQADNINVGLFDYPVLQAADILLYKAELVPVGQDQVQHIELARRIARSFNHRWGKVFPECQPLLTATPKILGLDGQAKMSKSLGNTISLGEPEKKVRKKLASAATDPARVTREDPGNPDVCNVFTIHKAVSRDEDLAWVREGCTTAGIGCVDCKTRLADNLLAELGPYHERRAALLAAPQQVKDILYAGADKARAAAKQTMDQVREKLGLWR